MFNSREYEWADVTVILGGRDLTGIRSVKYSEKIEREAVYAKGRRPHGIQSGNLSYEGEISMLQSEYEALVTSGNGSILSLSVDIEVAYGNAPDPIAIKRIEGVRFTEAAQGLKQGDKFMEITLPFIALNVANLSAGGNTPASSPKF
ncbi:MAG: hypothetical protein M9916_02110 [Crocinitomicaceae bacterium]|nr:hypothetical protein [Crocinitomicaceae bacterium]